MTDTDLLNALQNLNDESQYSGKCILRWSEYRRGWRLHETSNPKAQVNVRHAIEDFVKGR